MEKRTIPTAAESRYMSITDACGNYALGRQTVVNIAKEADAFCKIGKRVLIDRQRMNDYFKVRTGKGE